MEENKASELKETPGLFFSGRSTQPERVLRAILPNHNYTSHISCSQNIMDSVSHRLPLSVSSIIYAPRPCFQGAAPSQGLSTVGAMNAGHSTETEGSSNG